jgi:hypothetical protein
MQQTNPNQPQNIANLTSNSGKTVGELVNDLGLVANQLGNLLVASNEASVNVLRQTGKIVEGTNSSLPTVSREANNNNSNLQRSRYSQAEEASA